MAEFQPDVLEDEEETENRALLFYRENITENESSSGESCSSDGPFYGIDAIDFALHNIYSFERPVLISTPVKKIWYAYDRKGSGGLFPLDYIKVYSCNGYEDCTSPAHWHYITYGFSDLHGDGRVHEFTGRGHESGLGFELSFRVIKGDENKPPFWPVHILNALGKYTFETGFWFHEFDHVAWHCPLEKTGGQWGSVGEASGGQHLSQMRHLIIVEDPKIPTLDTPHGFITVYQLVGILKDEYRFARAYQSRSVVEQLLEHPQVGPLMVTDWKREKSIFDINPLFRDQAKDDMDNKGMWLAEIGGSLYWQEMDSLETEGQSGQGNQMSDQEACSPVKNVHLYFDASAAELLFLIIRGRLLRGRSFLFKSSRLAHSSKTYIIEFIPSNLDQEGGMNDDESTLILKGPSDEKDPRITIYCSHGLLEEMLVKFKELENITDAQETLPKEITFIRCGRVLLFHIHEECYPVKR